SRRTFLASWESVPFCAAGLPLRGPARAARVGGWLVDACGVDVGDDAFAHLIRADRGDHGAVSHRDDEGGAVDQDQGLPGPLRRGLAEAVLEPSDGGLASVDAPPPQPLERVAREVDGGGLVEL